MWFDVVDVLDVKLFCLMRSIFMFCNVRLWNVEMLLILLLMMRMFVCLDLWVV